MELGLGHHRQGDLLDDHGVAGERGADVLALEGAALEHPADRVGDGAGIDDRAVDNGIGRHGRRGKRGDAVPFAGRLQLHRLDCAGPDVQAYNGFDFTKHSTLCSGRQAARVAPPGDQECTSAGQPPCQPIR